MKNKLVKKLTGFLSMLLITVHAVQSVGQENHIISVVEYQFDPQQITIKEGDTVTWINQMGFHNVNGTQATYPANPESFGNSTGTDWTYTYVFNTVGNYNYQCDPHVGLGMVGEITVLSDVMITLNFSGMTPHVGQNLWLAVIDVDAGTEVFRTDTVVSESFTSQIPGLAGGRSYHVDFFVDFNENGYYDAPTTDHAWRIELENLMNDTILDFSHNTSFTDIEWTHRLRVNFSAMNPHVGQDLYLAVTDKNTQEEISRKSIVIEQEFMVDVYGIMPGNSYSVDFFADFNSNGDYDAPPTDHAWQLDLDDVVGDTTLDFVHNTGFTDIDWQHLIRINFSGMNPHVGQDLWLAVTDRDSGEEIFRTQQTVEMEFSLDIPGAEIGHDYAIDFFADHNGNGSYDAPPDDHAWRLELDDAQDFNEINFAHNTNFTDINWKYKLMINFSGMTPHVGQNLWLAVIDVGSGEEVDRLSTVVSESFSLEVSGLEDGKNFNVDFFVDFNENGYYDAPTTDHAWRIELESLMNDTTVDFVHNTSFTDIEWTHRLRVNFSSMNPHVGQDLYLAVTDKDTQEEISRTSVVIAQEFMVDVYGIVPGNSYSVDFFADFNSNGDYDAPPTDHAWQLALDNVAGDTTLDFVHNTGFTDIDWQHLIRINFSGMNPHVGQDLWLAVTDRDSGEEIFRTQQTVEMEFSLDIPGAEIGHDYAIDFFADHNGNGSYDAPPDDHAWRLELDDAQDFNEINFAHNTNFTDIDWMYQLTINFSGMNPHVGQDLWLAVKDMDSMEEIARTSTIVDTMFTLQIPGIESGHSYQVDFFADHNGNGSYDAPPDDHAWQLLVENVTGDTAIAFAHNTNFTDIEWRYMLSIWFLGMDPHLGQELSLFLFNTGTETYEDTLVLNSIEVSDFVLRSYEIMPGNSYNIDFFADHNGNGSYDAPPTDHAWRIMLEDVLGDTSISFSHNTDFTDIFEVVEPPELIRPNETDHAGIIQVYPNPSQGTFRLEGHQGSILQIYNQTGKLVYLQAIEEDSTEVVTDLSKGLYVLQIVSEDKVFTTKIIIE